MGQHGTSPALSIHHAPAFDQGPGMVVQVGPNHGLNVPTGQTQLGGEGCVLRLRKTILPAATADGDHHRLVNGQQTIEKTGIVKECSNGFALMAAAGEHALEHTGRDRRALAVPSFAASTVGERGGSASAGGASGDGAS